MKQLIVGLMFVFAYPVLGNGIDLNKSREAQRNPSKENWVNDISAIYELPPMISCTEIDTEIPTTLDGKTDCDKLYQQILKAQALVKSAKVSLSKAQFLLTQHSEEASNSKKNMDEVYSKILTAGEKLAGAREALIEAKKQANHSDLIRKLEKDIAELENQLRLLTQEYNKFSDSTLFSSGYSVQLSSFISKQKSALDCISNKLDILMNAYKLCTKSSMLFDEFFKNKKFEYPEACMPVPPGKMTLASSRIWVKLNASSERDAIEKGKEWAVIQYEKTMSDKFFGVNPENCSYSFAVQHDSGDTIAFKSNDPDDDIKWGSEQLNIPGSSTKYGIYEDSLRDVLGIGGSVIRGWNGGNPRPYNPTGRFEAWLKISCFICKDDRAKNGDLDGTYPSP